MRGFPWKDALTAGLAMARAHPRAVFVWVLIAFCREVMFSALAAGVFALINNPVTRAWADGPAGEAGYAALSFLIPEGISAVLICAVLRALLTPDQSKGRFVRLGVAELLMLLLILLASLGVLAVGLAGTLAVGLGARALGRPVTREAASFVGALAGVMACIRFAPAPAIVVDRRRMALVAAWKIARGAYGPLLLILAPAMLAEERVRQLARQLAPQWQTLPWDGVTRLGLDLWTASADVLFLIFGAGVIAAVYRRETAG